jgi:hypothetical protein
MIRKRMIRDPRRLARAGADGALDAGVGRTELAGLGVQIAQNAGRFLSGAFEICVYNGPDPVVLAR